MSFTTMCIMNKLIVEVDGIAYPSEHQLFTVIKAGNPGGFALGLGKCGE